VNVKIGHSHGRRSEVQTSFHVHRDQSVGIGKVIVYLASSATCRFCVRNRILAAGSSGVTARSLPFPDKSWQLYIRTLVFTRACPRTLATTTVDRVSILDDLLNKVYSKDVCDLLIKGSHHRNISVFLIIQNLFHQVLSRYRLTLNIPS